MKFAFRRISLGALGLLTLPGAAQSLNTSPAQKAQARPSRKFMLVRGTKITLPFELRVLVREINRNETLELGGMGLRDERGRVIGDRPLHCYARKDATFGLTLLNSGPTERPLWICRNPGYERAVSGRMRVMPMAGFVRANHEMYRQSLELIPRGNKLLVINNIDIEDYLAGLINREIKSNYPREAVKAQAIAARSYALATAADRRRAGELFDVYGTIQDQVYRGTTLEDGVSFRLVDETRGQVLFHREDVLKAYYHASSGGHSELPQVVWGDHNAQRDALAYLARPSEFDEALADSRWSITLTPSLGLQWPGIGRIVDLRVLERSSGRRVQQIEVTGSDGMETMSGPEFRQKLGYNWIKSTYFYVKRLTQGWLLEGRGYGHGVGLSQLGAKAMAKAGKTSEDILSFYYPYADVRKLNLDNSAPDLTIGTR